MVNLPLAIDIRRQAAEQLGYAFNVLDPDTGYLYEIRRGDRRKVFVSSESPLNDAAAARLASDKFYTQVVLTQAGIRVPHTVRCLRPNAFVFSAFEAHTGLDSGVRFADTHGFPVVVKPNQGTWNLGVQAVDDPDGLVRAVQEVWQKFTLALVQEAIPGCDLRLNFLGNAWLTGYLRLGSGLILSLRSGASLELLPSLDPTWRALGLRIGQVLGLEHFGIDFKIPHPAAPPQEATVLDVNASPMVGQLAQHGHVNEALDAEMKVLRRWFEHG